MTTKEPLWSPSPQRIAEAQITAYRAWLKQHKGLHFDHYEALWQWSTEEFEAFWESIWEYGEVMSHRPYQRVVNQQEMPGVSWFEGATLNYAEHILAPGTQAESVNAPRSWLSQRLAPAWKCPGKACVSKQAHSANRDSMGNPYSIDWFVEFARARNSCYRASHGFQEGTDWEKM